MVRSYTNMPMEQPLTTTAVPFAGTIKNGEVVKIECLDWTGGQIGNNNSADDVKNVDLTRIHYLSGPFEVETAEPGDILIVEIQDVQPFQEQPWGFTGVFDKKNGGGLLDDLYPNAWVSSPLATVTIANYSSCEGLKQSGISKGSSVPHGTSRTFASLV